MFDGPTGANRRPVGTWTILSKRCDRIVREFGSMN